jgi:hypothetical protein
MGLGGSGEEGTTRYTHYVFITAPRLFYRLNQVIQNAYTEVTVKFETIYIEGRRGPPPP